MSETDTGQLFQYTSVAIDGRALLIEGPSGCGKSSLALSLIDKGAVLIGDDSVSLTVESGNLIASPAPNTRGLIEIRNVGLIELPCTPAPVSLVLTVDPDAPRFTEKAHEITLLGYSIPTLEFALGNPADAIRAEYAMRRYGLSTD